MLTHQRVGRLVEVRRDAPNARDDCRRRGVDLGANRAPLLAHPIDVVLFARIYLHVKLSDIFR